MTLGVSLIVGRISEIVRSLAVFLVATGVFGVPVSGNAGTNRWTSIGPGGGAVNALVVNVANPETAGVVSATAPICNSDGTYCEFSVPTPDAFPLGIVAGPDGNLWFTEAKSGKIGRITLTGEITEFETGSGVGALNPIVVGSDGNLWFTEAAYSWAHNILLVTASRIGRITPEGVVNSWPSDLAIPHSIAAGPDGEVWYTTDVAGVVFKINPRDGTISLVRSGVLPASITAGPDGALWMALGFGGQEGQILRLTVDGELTKYPMTAGWADSLVTGPDGLLWFVGIAGSSAVGRVALSGAVTIFPTRPSWSLGAITPGPDGNLWFTASEAGEARLGRITTAGVITEFILPVVPSTVGRPLAGIASGPDGNLWITEPVANKIGVFRVPLEREKPFPTSNPRRPRPVDIRRAPSAISR